MSLILLPVFTDYIMSSLFLTMVLLILTFSGYNFMEDWRHQLMEGYLIFYILKNYRQIMDILSAIISISRVIVIADIFYYRLSHYFKCDNGYCKLLILRIIRVMVIEKFTISISISIPGRGDELLKLCSRTFFI